MIKGPKEGEGLPVFHIPLARMAFGILVRAFSILSRLEKISLWSHY